MSKEKSVKECVWTKHLDEGMYTTECGKVQGMNVRPKQKICYCGRKIKKVDLKTLSAPMTELLESLN